MIQVSIPIPLEEYLAYDDGTDTCYTLVNWELIALPTESDLINSIALYVLSVLLQFVPIQRMRRCTEIVLSGSRATTRIPNLRIVREELAAMLAEKSRSIILLDMPSPDWVMEVVSEGKKMQSKTTATNAQNMQPGGFQNTGL
jgi:Uma2 family endonuclease